ncbi:MAG: caspase family protein [Myxococcales bacterium]
MRTFFGILSLLVGALCCLPRARAEGPLHTYALVVGSNRGGAGQAHLSFAEHDAERMAEVLVELGRTPTEHVQLLKQPSARELEQALVELAKRVQDHAGQGERSQVLFYYSGHARARSLSLDQEEVALDTLRKALTALPSTLTVVVLDACQSGAFSGVKGAAPAADFSLSSVNDLHSQGIAVMASSTAAELSQESPELGSSYFSHHLVAALRGAGDGNGDGRVSLDEAYGYAYQHTLSDTARTQVGTQHATLETDIRGRGDVPLSYPVDADAQLSLPAELEGRVMVQKENRGVVIAEIVKAAGSPLSLALPAGKYDVVVRKASGRDTRQCSVTLARGATYALDPRQCAVVAETVGVAKAAGTDDFQTWEAQREAERKNYYEHWFFEVGGGLNSKQDDDYTRTLGQFRFAEDLGQARVLGLDTSAGVGLTRHLSLLAHYDNKIERRVYTRSLQGPDSESRDERFSWTTRAVSLGLRARLALSKKEWVVGFAEGDVGLGIARTRMVGTGVHSFDHDFGLVLRGLLGLTFGVAEYFGVYLAGGYTYAPVTSNLIGQTHNDGGVTIVTGVRVRGMKGAW